MFHQGYCQVNMNLCMEKISKGLVEKQGYRSFFQNLQKHSPKEAPKSINLWDLPSWGESVRDL